MFRLRLRSEEKKEKKNIDLGHFCQLLVLFVLLTLSSSLEWARFRHRRSNPTPAAAKIGSFGDFESISGRSSSGGRGRGRCEATAVPCTGLKDEIFDAIRADGDGF